MSLLSFFVIMEEMKSAAQSLPACCIGQVMRYMYISCPGWPCFPLYILYDVGSLLDADVLLVACCADMMCWCLQHKLIEPDYEPWQVFCSEGSCSPSQ